MKYMFYRKFFYFVLAGVIFASCLKKDDFDFSNSSIKIDGTWGIALVDAEVAFEDFTLDSALSILSDEDIVRIIYSSPMVTSGELDELLPMFDYHWSFSLTDIDEPATAPYSDSTIFSGQQDILFYEDTNQLIIDTAVFNAGNLQLVLNNTVDHNIKFKLKSQYFHYPNGRILDTLLTVPYNANNYVINLDLTGCRVKLRNNSLPCEIEIVVNNDGHPFSGATKSMTVDVYGSVYVLKLVQGKVAMLTERISAETDFSIRNDNKMSFLVRNIKDGQIRMNSFNGFGSGAKIIIDTCDLITNGVAASILSPAHSIIEFEPATTYFTTKNQSLTLPLNTFSIANDNVFRFGGMVYVNEPGITGADVWAVDKSSFSIEPTLEIPLDFNLNHFIYRDTIAQEISRIENIDFMKSLTFRVEMLNDFPIELNAQVYFLDGNYRILDSLFSNQTLISAASINSTNGKTIAPGKMTPSPLFIEIIDTRLNRIYETKYICIDARATSNNQPTIVRSDHKLKIKVGAKVTLKTAIKNNSNEK